MSTWSKMLTLLNRPCFNTFSVPVVYTPSLENGTGLAGTPIDLVGIFDEKREVVSLMGGGGMDAVIPRSVLEIRVADLGTTPMVGDDVSINGVPYRVLEVQPDGMGLAVLILNRQQDPFCAMSRLLTPSTNMKSLRKEEKLRFGGRWIGRRWSCLPFRLVPIRVRASARPNPKSTHVKLSIPKEQKCQIKQNPKLKWRQILPPILPPVRRRNPEEPTCPTL